MSSVLINGAFVPSVTADKLPKLQAAVVIPTSDNVTLQSRKVDTVFPLSPGDSNLTRDRIISMLQAAAHRDGYLFQEDWDKFRDNDASLQAFNAFIVL